MTRLYAKSNPLCRGLSRSAPGYGRDAGWWRTACWTAAVVLLMSIGGSMWAISAVSNAGMAAVVEAPEALKEIASAAGSQQDDEPAPVEAAPAILPPLPVPPPMRDTLVLSADLRTQRLTVIEDDKRRYTWPISSGRPGFATQTGRFRPQWASRLWHSIQYENAPMPHAVFFHQGMAFHATNAIGMLGRPASHGCIRLAAGNAALLYKLVHKHGFAHTKIIVHNGSKSPKPVLARKA